MYDEGSLLPTDGAGTLSIPMPNWLGGFDDSDDCRRLLLLTAPEEAVQAVQPSGAAPESRALQERASTFHASHRQVTCDSEAPQRHASLDPALHASASSCRAAQHTGRRSVQGLYRKSAGCVRLGLADEVRVCERRLLACDLHAKCRCYPAM